MTRSSGAVNRKITKPCTSSTSPHGLWPKRLEFMAQCEVCGNDYDKAISVMVSGGDSHTFDSFECAIHALAPICEYCNVKVIGHGVETDDSFYCCAHCARMAGAEGVSDRA